MKKVLVFLLTFPLLLTGCGQAKEVGKDLQGQYVKVATAEMEAEVTSHMTTEDRTYTLRCTYDAHNGAATEILAPEELKGISATIGIDGLKVAYNGTAVSSGELQTLCPANCLPWLMEALAHGYLQSEGEETAEGVPCYRLVLENAAMDGSKILCSAWLDQETLIPRYAEFTTGDQVTISLVMQSFSCTTEEGE